MRTCLIFWLSIILVSCNKESREPDDPEIPVVTDKLYVLPYPVGKAYSCVQGFNDPFSHYGSFRYSVDFAMPIGTYITASRNGTIVYIVVSNYDNDSMDGHENVVIVMHNDGNYSRYVHLTHNGAIVKLNQVVMRGDTIGLSGNSGSTASPHLHFDVTNTFTGRNDQTVPFDFSNTQDHPVGLKKGVLYEAFPY